MNHKLILSLFFVVFLTSFACAQLEARPKCNLGEQMVNQSADGRWLVWECDGYAFTGLKEICPVGQIPVRDMYGKYNCQNNKDNNLILYFIIILLIVIIAVLLVKSRHIQKAKKDDSSVHHTH